MHDLLLEAAHSFAVQAPFVGLRAQLKWADAMAIAVGIAASVEAEQDAKPLIPMLRSELEAMVYAPIAAIAMAHVALFSREPVSKEMQAPLAALQTAIGSASTLSKTNPIAAKTLLMGAVNMVRAAAKEPIPMLPSRDEIMRGGPLEWTGF